MMEDLGRYIRTIRHLRPSQVAWRLRYMLRRKFRLHPRPAMPHPAPAFDAEALASLRSLMMRRAELAPPAPESLADWRQGRFVFLQEAVDTDGRPPWGRDDMPRLWRYHLHYFEYARDLALANTMAPEGGDGERVLGWIHDWIDKNPPGADVAWDAFPIAARLMNWALAEAVFGFDDVRLRASYAQQAAYLRCSLEYDLLANHLLQNACGLAVADGLLGSTADGPGARLLQRQLDEQLVGDGGHFELSAMYHAHALLDSLVAFAAQGNQPDWLARFLNRMADYLESVCHPDGGIPLFGDAALGAALPPEALCALVREHTGAAAAAPQEGCYPIEPSGFYVLADAHARMTVKAGEPGPSYQLGHAHCDALSYEFSVGTRRVLVDSGVHGYAGSPWREYCRSTRAHNTVSVNGLEQLECWSNFRVGRRYIPLVFDWTETPHGRLLRAGHDGFQPFLHVRTVLHHHDGFFLVQDRVTGPGECNTESYVHIHPDLALSNDGGIWRMSGGDVDAAIVLLGADDVRVVQGETDPRQGWYCPEFGVALPAPVLVLHARGPLGYAIFPHVGGVLPTETLEDLIRELHGTNER